MTPDDKQHIDDIEARANAATKGPWEAERTAAFHRFVSSDKIYGRVICYTSVKDVDEVDEDNITFIAASRADIPWLIAYARKLEREIELEHEYVHKVEGLLDSEEAK